MIIKDCDCCPFRDGRPVVQFEGNISVIIKDRERSISVRLCQVCGATLNSGLHVTLSDDSHLRKTTVHKKFRPGDIATLIRCEKHHSLSDLIRPPKPAERDCASDHLAPLLTRFARCKQILQAGRVDGTWADRVD